MNPAVEEVGLWCEVIGDHFICTLNCVSVILDCLLTSGGWSMARRPHGGRRQRPSRDGSPGGGCGARRRRQRRRRWLRSRGPRGPAALHGRGAHRHQHAAVDPPRRPVHQRQDHERISPDAASRHPGYLVPAGERTGQLHLPIEQIDGHMNDFKKKVLYGKKWFCYGNKIRDNK